MGVLVIYNNSIFSAHIRVDTANSSTLQLQQQLNSYLLMLISKCILRNNKFCKFIFRIFCSFYEAPFINMYGNNPHVVLFDIFLILKLLNNHFYMPT